VDVVVCHNLTKQYGQRRAVDGLSLNIEEGEVCGLLGLNGAGKTTLFRLLLGLARPTGGSARLFGQPVPPGPNSLRRIGAMVEEPAFYGWMRPVEQLRVGAMASGLKPCLAQIRHALDRVDLGESADKPIKRYSQGMRQRLGLARALMGEPSLLMLDEPANGLDPAGIVWLRELLRELAASGTTIVVSSHQLGEVERICSRVVILDHGRVADVVRMPEFGSPEQQVRVVIREEDMKAAAPALAGFQVSDVSGGAFTVSNAEGSRVVEALAKCQVFPDSVHVEKGWLERRFLEITGTAR
jgi:ABC-2 type transport system ATP-binding protein